MNYPFSVSLPLIILLISVVTDFATYERREGRPWKLDKAPFRSYIIHFIVSVFFVLFYYVIPAILVVLCIRWLAGLGIVPSKTDLTYADAVLKCALLICLADNYADFVAAFFKGRLNFFGFLFKALFTFSLSYLGAMALAWGLIKIYYGNSMVIASGAVFALHFTHSSSLNLIVTIVVFLLAGILSYILTRSRLPALREEEV